MSSNRKAKEEILSLLIDHVRIVYSVISDMGVYYSTWADDSESNKKDLEKKIIRAVGNAEDRFSEDALRMMRAARFAVTLDFKIESKTSQAIKKNSYWLQAISKERLRDEFLKIIMKLKAIV